MHISVYIIVDFLLKSRKRNSGMEGQRWSGKIAQPKDSKGSSNSLLYKA